MKRSEGLHNRSLLWRRTSVRWSAVRGNVSRAARGSALQFLAMLVVLCGLSPATVPAAAMPTAEQHLSRAAGEDLSSLDVIRRELSELDATETRESAVTSNSTELPTDGVDAAAATTPVPVGDTSGTPWAAWIDPTRVAGTVQLALTMTLLGLAPALLLLTTAYVRISVVLAVLRQAFGTQQLLPMQVTTALAMFCTGFVMWPTWRQVHDEAVVPWLHGESPPAWMETAQTAILPIRNFMVRQIEHQGNADDVHLFVKRMVDQQSYPASYDEVPLRALMPAFLLSELKTAFMIGFQIYLPFLVIELVVAAVTTSMGMFMLPPSAVALPLKMLLFVLVDGWRLLVEMLLNSFQ